MFGCTLNPDSEQIPLVVYDCVTFLETPGKDFLKVLVFPPTNLTLFKTEGIFRQSANQQVVLQLKARYMKGEKVNLSAEIQDPHIVASLLKLWLRFALFLFVVVTLLREMAEPLLMYEFVRILKLMFFNKTSTRCSLLQYVTNAILFVFIVVQEFRM